MYYSSFHTYSRSSPSGKAAGEDVPMEDNPAYGDVNIYDTVKEPEYGDVNIYDTVKEPKYGDVNIYDTVKEPKID